MNQQTSRRDFVTASTLFAADLAFGPSHASSSPPDDRKEIRKRKLGTLEVSALGLGCMGMSFFYGPVRFSSVYYPKAQFGGSASCDVVGKIVEGRHKVMFRDQRWSERDVSPVSHW